MAKGSFRFPLYGGGSDPDPSVFCPANGYELPPDPAVLCPAEGYVLDEPGSASWELVFEFYTNSPASTTFDPSVGGFVDSNYAWKIGANIYFARSLSVVLDGSLQKVQLYIKTGTPITSINMSADHIVGKLVFYHPSISMANSYQAMQNPELTGVLLHFSETANAGNLYFYSCNITGIVDFSSIRNAGTIALRMYSNPNLTGIIFHPILTTGTLFFYEAYSCNLTGMIDLRMFTRLQATGASIKLNDNPNLESIQMPVVTSGVLQAFYAHNCNLKGTLDLSGITAYGSSSTIYAYNNPLLEEIIFPVSASGVITGLNVNGCNLKGILDLSCFTSFGTNASIQFYNNPLLKGVVLAATISGAIGTFSAYNCDLTGILDLSMVTFNSTQFSLTVYDNENLTEIILPSNGKILSINAYRCNLSYINIKDIPNGTDKAYMSIALQDNAMTAAEVNRILAEVDSVSVSGYASRSLRLTGTNAAPDSSSGGYDGLAAKASLQSKGFIVYTN